MNHGPLDLQSNALPIVWRIPEDGNGDPKYLVVLNALTFLGNEARPFSPLAYDLASKKP